MNRITITTLLATIGLASAAQAQSGPGRGPMPDPWGDATVTRAEEQAKAAERFAALDTNKDGAISDDEQEAARAAGPGGGGFGLRRADADGDGRITSAEFLAAQLQRFDMQDANKDGQLTKAERDAARAERMNRGGWGGPPPGEGPRPGGE